MEQLKYQLGFSFKVNKDIEIRDGLVLKGTPAYLEEISESEYDGDGGLTPYKVLFDKCLVDDNEFLKDDEGDIIGGTAWFSEKEIESIISSEKV